MADLALTKRRRGYLSPRARRDNPLPPLDALLLADWPFGDRLLWQKALDAGAVLDEPGPAASWRPDTRYNRMMTYGRFLRCLEMNGQLDPDEPMSARVTRERAIQFLDHSNATLSPVSARQQIHTFSFFLMACLPGEDWRWLRRLPGLPSEREAMASRQDRQHVEPGVILVPILQRLDELQNHFVTMPVAREIMELTLVLVGFYTKLRVGNLVSLEIGRTIFPAEQPVRITFEPQETKTRKLLDTRLQPEPSQWLDFYLQEARPVLIGKRPDPGALWVHTRGSGVADRTAWGIFQRTGQRFLGHPISPHSTRHSFATTMMRSHPDKLRTAAAGLGHRGNVVLLQHYDHSGTVAAEAVWKKALRRVTRGNG